MLNDLQLSIDKFEAVSDTVKKRIKLEPEMNLNSLKAVCKDFSKLKKLPNIFKNDEVMTASGYYNTYEMRGGDCGGFGKILKGFDLVEEKEIESIKISTESIPWSFGDDDGSPYETTLHLTKQKYKDFDNSTFFVYKIHTPASSCNAKYIFSPSVYRFVHTIKTIEFLTKETFNDRALIKQVFPNGMDSEFKQKYFEHFYKNFKDYKRVNDKTAETVLDALYSMKKSFAGNTDIVGSEEPYYKVRGVSCLEDDEGNAIEIRAFDIEGYEKVRGEDYVKESNDQSSPCGLWIWDGKKDHRMLI